MNKFWLVLTIIFLLFSGCKRQSKSESLNWKEFVSDEGKFKATFPVNPTKTVKETDVPSGKLQNTRFESSSVEPVIYFGVWYADHSNVPNMNQDALRINYDNIRDVFAKAPNTELLSEKEVWVNEKLGRELTLKTGNQTAKNRMFLVGNRQYQLITSTNSSVMEDAEAQRTINKFLDSFQLVEK
jgi:hypothetical protein